MANDGNFNTCKPEIVGRTKLKHGYASSRQWQHQAQLLQHHRHGLSRMVLRSSSMPTFSLPMQTTPCLRIPALHKDKHSSQISYKSKLDEIDSSKQITRSWLAFIYSFSTWKTSPPKHLLGCFLLQDSEIKHIDKCAYATRKSS